MNELFTQKHWSGEFFLPGGYAQRFGGDIAYSPGNGAVLSYAIRGAQNPPATEILHGVLANGEKCTLAGSFLAGRSGKAGFPCLAIGEFLAKGDKFRKFYFSLANLEDFFFPGGSKAFAKYEQKAIYSVRAPFGKLEVVNTASFGALKDDIASHIHSFEPAALDELNDAFSRIRKKYPRAFLMLKKDIEYRLLLEYSRGATVAEACAQISRVADLFALLAFRPVHPGSIHVAKASRDIQPTTIAIYPALELDSQEAGARAHARRPGLLPITRDTIPFESVIGRWLESPPVNPAVISAIQHGPRPGSLRPAHAEIVLYAAQFESIAHLAGRREKRHAYVLSTHACRKLQDEMGRLLGQTGAEAMGKALGEIRNEIADMGKPGKWLAKLPRADLLRISRLLQLTIIGSTLAGIGVPPDAIVRYQEWFSLPASEGD